MNRALLSKRISSLLAEVSRLSNALCAMNTMDLQRYPENYELLSTDAALRAEQIACRMRHLVYGFTTVQKHEYLTSAANVLGITITAQPGLVEITLPGLLPKKKQRSAEYLTDPLEQALGQFVKDHPLSHFESCIICFCHIYAVSGGRGRIRDYDNLEMKQILDVVCAYLTPSTMKQRSCARTKRRHIFRAGEAKRRRPQSHLRPARPQRSKRMLLQKSRRS